MDDAETPLKELRRLVSLQRAYNHMNAGDDAVEHKDNEAALREYSMAEKMIEGMADVDQSRLAEMIFWHAVALVNMQRVDESLPLFQRAYKMHPQWREVVPRLPKSGLLPDDPDLIKRIVNVSATLSQCRDTGTKKCFSGRMWDPKTGWTYFCTC